MRVGFWQKRHRPGMWLGGFRLFAATFAVGNIDDVLCCYVGVDDCAVGFYFGSRFEPIDIKRVGGFYRLALGPLAIAFGWHG